MKIAAKLLAMVVLTTPGTTIPAAAQSPITSARYVDATGGDDANDGASPTAAWRTLENVNSVTFGPGGAILFKAGEAWEGQQLWPKGSGEEGAPITIDRYGEGPLPALHGNGIPSVLFLANEEYWEIQNLEITNLEPLGPGETPIRKRAVHIGARDMGQVDHIYLRNLVIRDVNSEQESFDSRYYGGIFLQITGETTPTWFNDLRIEDCHVYNVDRTGISTDSSWWERGLDSEFGEVLENTSDDPDRFDRWVPSTNVVIRNNLLEHIGGNGVIVRTATNALVEHNRVFFAGEDISGNGMFCFNTDSTFFQFNEVANTIYNEGDTDARGIDSDFRTKHTIIQYNYLHHNGYGGVVATGGSGEPTSVPRFNHGTVIRYNVLVDNEHHIVRASGNMTDMIVHNNVVFTSEEYDAGATITVVQHGSWGGAWPIHTAYYNNIFLTQGAQARYSLGSSLNNAFENNLYEGATAYSRPSDPNPVTGDPLFVARKTTPGWPGLEGFELQITSPAIGQGRIVEGAPESDFFGNAVPTTGPIDVGVHQFSSPTGFERLPASPHPDAPVVYPNPARGSVTLAFSTPRAGMASLTLFDLLGRQVASWEEVLTTGTNRIALDLTHRNLPAGLYHITVEDDGPAVRSAELILIGGGDNTR